MPAYASNNKTHMCTGSFLKAHMYYVCYLADASASFACLGAVRDKDLVAPDPTVPLPSSVRSSEGTAEAQLNNGKRGGGGGGNDTRPRYSCYIWFVG